MQRISKAAYLSCISVAVLLTAAISVRVSLRLRSGDLSAFITTFTNAVPPAHDPALVLSDQYGNYFFGEKGMMLVNRYGYWLKPNPPRRPMQMGPNGPSPVPNAPVPPLPFEAKSFLDPAGPNELPDTTYGSATVHHARNFLDCVKSRHKPVCDIEIGFHSTLPCLLALEAIRKGSSVGWDGKLMKAV